MNKLTTLGLMATVYTNQALAGACDASSPAEMAQIFGVDAATVTEETSYQRKTTSECLWTLQNVNGNPISITFRTFDKTEKITNPEFFKNNQKYLVENGNQVGNTKLTYHFEPLPNTEHGILSAPYGNKYTNTLHYIWVKGEERRLGVTYSITMNEAGELTEPTLADIQQTVSIFTD